MDDEVHGLHAMLLLGSFTEPEEGMTLYVMWNWWERMPLVAVSLEYMIACQCQVYFLNAVLSKDLLQKQYRCNFSLLKVIEISIVAMPTSINPV